MSTVAGVISSVKANVGDENGTRYSAAMYLEIVKQAVNRANRIAQRAGLQFAKKYTDLTTTDGQAYVSMPVDFDVDIQLCIPATYIELEKLDESAWNALVSPAANSYYMLDYVNLRILLAGTPEDSTTSLRLYYYPTVDTSSYTTATTMPWSGRLDDIIVQYATMRLLNIAEMDTATEMSLIQDFEIQIMEAYRPLRATLIERKGWIN